MHPMCCAACRHSISELRIGRRVFPDHGGDEAAHGRFGTRGRR
jgi:hypothetical protein